MREMEIPPEEYYPADYHPELLTEWPVDGDLVIPLEQMPPAMLASMGENWRDHQAYKKHISELTARGRTRPSSSRLRLLASLSEIYCAMGRQNGRPDSSSPP